MQVTAFYNPTFIVVFGISIRTRLNSVHPKQIMCLNIYGFYHLICGKLIAHYLIFNAIYQFRNELRYLLFVSLFCFFVLVFVFCLFYIINRISSENTCHQKKKNPQPTTISKRETHGACLICQQIFFFLMFFLITCIWERKINCQYMSTDCNLDKTLH